MKKILMTIFAGITALTLAACSSQSASSNNNANSQTTNSDSGASVLFINASQNKDGNTVKMSKDVLDGVNYDELDLVDYRINQLGQTFDGDQFNEVVDRMKKADTIVIGTPVYWHTMSGSLKTLIDRFSDMSDINALQGKKLYFFMQGSAPTEQAISSTEFIISRVAAQTNMDLVAMADNNAEVAQMNSQLKANAN